MKNLAKAEARKNEILDIAEKLFLEKGYDQTTINDILNVSGFAKGSLYYYYKSKEDILDGIIKRRGDMNIEAANGIVQATNLTIVEKLLLVIQSQKPVDEKQKQLTADYEKSSNGQMFIKSLADIVKRLAPIIGDIIEQGVIEGIFSTPYPLESAQILLATAHTLFDNNELKWSVAEEVDKMKAFVFVVERTLGVAEGSLTAMNQAVS